MDYDLGLDRSAGDEIYQAIKDNDVEKIENFIATYGVNAKFRFTENTGMGEWVRDSTILLAAIMVGNNEVAKDAIERGAEFLVSEMNIPALELSADIHPITAAIESKRSDVLRLMASKQVDLDVSLVEVHGKSFQSKQSLKEAVEAIRGSNEYLASLGIEHILDEQKPARKKTPGPR